jgi:hypothetical protein
LAASSFGAAFGMSSNNPSPFVALFAAMVANRIACVLVCLLVSLLVCLLVCLVACLLAWVFWNGLLHTNLQNPFIVILKPSFGSPMERCVINKETRQPSIHKKNKPTSKRTFTSELVD